MSAKNQIASKRKVKRAGSKSLRTKLRANTYPRKDGVVAPAIEPDEVG